MANKIVYLEPDDEITSVIDRIRHSEEHGVVLVIPRGGTIGQSIVNLKLLMRNADTLDKSIGLITGDRITKNLASQLQLKVFSKPDEAEKAILGKTEVVVRKPSSPIKISESEVASSGLKVNTYQKYSGEDADAEEISDLVEGSESGEIAEESLKGAPSGPDNESESDEETEEEEPHFAKASRGADAEEEDIQSAYKDEEPPEVIPSGSAENNEDIEESHNIHVEQDAGDDDEEVEVSRPVSDRSGKKHLKPAGSRKVLIIAISAIVLVILAVSYIFIPYAEASVTVKTTDLSQDLNIVADKSQTGPDFSKLTFKANLLSVEKDGTKQADATGSRDAGAKAIGTVTLFNKLGNNVLINSSTIIIRDDKQFIPSKSVFIPAATGSFTTDSTGHLVAVTTPGQINVDVTAAANGDGSNLAPGKFTISGKNSSDVWAENAAAFTGGVTKIEKYVSDGDIAKASLSLRTDLATQLKTELSDQAANDGSKFDNASLKDEIVSTSTDKNANDVAASFTTTMHVRVFGISFLEKDMKALVFGNIESGLASDAMLINQDQSTIDYTVAKTDVDSGTVAITAKFSGKVGSKIDTNAISKNLVNKSAASALQYLRSQNGVQNATVNITPRFFHNMPVLSSKIKVKFEYSN